MEQVLEAWGPVRLVRSLGGGNRNEVLEVELAGRRLVARRSRRPPASLSWEIQLLEHLRRSGVRVPAVVPTPQGRRHVAGVVLTTWLDGRPPEPGDWPAVAATLRRIAATAWEAANGGTVEPSYARRQLEMLLAGREGFSSAGPGSMSP